MLSERVFDREISKVLSKLKGGGIIVDLFSGIWKTLCKGCVLDVICIVTAYPMLRLNDEQVKIW